MLKRSRSASVQFSTPSSFLLLFFLFQRLFSFFCFCFQRPSLFLFSASFCFFSSCLSFLFSSHMPLFSAQKHSFQPKTIFSSAQKHFFSPNVFQPKSFSVFQPKRFCFNSATLLFFFFSCFILFWFSHLFSLSMPPFFLFFSSVYPRLNILSSCFTSLLFK